MRPGEEVHRICAGGQHGDHCEEPVHLVGIGPHVDVDPRGTKSVGVGESLVVEGIVAGEDQRGVRSPRWSRARSGLTSGWVRSPSPT